MNLEMIGINHETSDLQTRERAAIEPEKFPETYKSILEIPGIDGVTIVSTCNRVEVYLSPRKHLPEDELRNLFGKICDLPPEETARAYIYRDEETARHLFNVASGLNSQMIGEVEILGQVKASYYIALDLGSVSSLLNRLFHKAIECGKFVRERTTISKGAVSVAFAAVDLASKIYGNLENVNVLIIGAGQTGQLAAKHFKKAGAKSWRISNRTQERADELSKELSATSVSFPPGDDDISWADIIVSATGAPGYIIETNGNSKLGRDKDTPVCFLDLAVPRDIDPRFKEFDNVFVYTVDDFNEMVAANKAAREKESTRAEKFVSQRVDSFVKWHRENRVAPTIQQLQEIIEGIRLAEIERYAKRFCEDDREKVDKFSKSLVKKVLGLLIANMKKASVDQDDLSIARAVLLAFSQQNKDDLNEILEKIDYELSHR